MNALIKAIALEAKFMLFVTQLPADPDEGEWWNRNAEAERRHFFGFYCLRD